MLCEIKIMEKVFNDKESFDYLRSYRKACNWVADCIALHDDMKDDMTWNIRRIKDSYGSVKLTLYTTIDLSSEKNSFCESCKKYHKSFFINEDFNCSRCNMITYLDRLNTRGKIKKSYKKEMLQKILRE